MAKPPSDAPVLFDVKCDSSTIKQRKDGSYKLVMKGVERVHWETAEAEAEDGYYNAKKYTKNFDMYYGKDAEVSAYETFTLADGSKEKCKFTITDAKYNQKSNKLVYDITPKNKRQADKITGLEGEAQVEGALYTTRSTRWRPYWLPNGGGRHLRNDEWTEEEWDAHYARIDDWTEEEWEAYREWEKEWEAQWEAEIAQYEDWTLEEWEAHMEAEMGFGGGRKDHSFADLSKADLRNADLSGARMTYANLNYSDLRGANLRNADLMGAQMYDADLRDADLRGADLSFADLTEARLRGADLNDAIWSNTQCPNYYTNRGSQPC